MAGSLLGFRPLLAVGALSGAAPLPRVFSRQQGIETYARRARIEIRTAGGGVHERAVDPTFGRRVRGPVVRRAAYAHAALYAGLPGSERRRTLLQRGFCAPGDVARELGIEAPVTSVRVRSWSALANEEPVTGLDVRCER